MEKLLYTIDEARDVLSLGRSTLYRLLAEGAIQSVWVGRSRRVPADALRRFVAERESAVKAA